MTTRHVVALGIVVSSASLLVTSPRAQQQPPAGPPGFAPGARVVAAVRHDVSRPLRELAVIAPDAEGERAAHPPLRFRRAGSKVARPDPALQLAVPAPSIPLPTVNFDGVASRDGVLPPDTNGDVGPNHYVQWVNLSYAIYSKSGQLLVGPARGNTIFTGFGGPCATRNDGDPIVLYDEQANRWLLSQFALPNYPNGPFYQCIAVSSSGDPTGSYHRYAFSFDKMNDYPKFGVWPDGYYLAVNQFAAGTGGWAGQGVAVFERARMLAGQAARMTYFDLFAADPNIGGMLPSDLDGDALPPAGAPNQFVTFDDNAWGYSPDQLQVWAFRADWSDPTRATFTPVGTLGTAAFDSNLCNYARNCIPQPNTGIRLDAIADRLMYRLQYRNLGSHESWVVNHTVDVNGSNLAGVRWYELRRSSAGSLAIHQQGTFSPDAAHRWMGSAAMDGAGNIAVAYNVGSGTVSPSVRYTGRAAGDPPNQMTLGEGDIVVGAGAQTSTSSRWGDYSMLAVDPTDDCTFWATLEYTAARTTASWRTRIAAFRLPGCGGTEPPPPTAPTAPSNLTATTSVSGQTAVVNLAWRDNSSTEDSFQITRDGAVIETTGANVTTYADTTVQRRTSYRYGVRACLGTLCSPLSNTVNVRVK